MSYEAVVFPGQGAQRCGMGQDFYQSFAASKAVFECASQYVDFDITAVCFEDNRDIHQTRYTQPCIVTAEVAMFEGLKERYGNDFSPHLFAGHSLGEYAALVAAGVLPFEIAIQLVSKRGQLMQDTDVSGGMAAIILDDLPLSDISEIAAKHGVDVANDNSLTQVVISGEHNAVNAVTAELEQTYQEQGIRCVMLNVSAPFHSRYMQSVEEAFHAYLQSFQDSFAINNLPKVASNYLGRFYQADVNEAIMALAKQLSGNVKWRDNMAALSNQTQSILELGPNRPLRGFFKTLAVDVDSVINLRSADKVFKSLNA